MIADAAEPRRIEQRRRNDLAHKRQNRQIRLEGNELLGYLRRLERFVLMHRDTELKRSLLDRIDSSAGRVGKTEHAQHLLSIAEMFIECLFRKRRLADEDDSQGRTRFPIGDISR